jgi:hypothetical protein
VGVGIHQAGQERRTAEVKAARLDRPGLDPVEGAAGRDPAISTRTAPRSRGAVATGRTHWAVMSRSDMRRLSARFPYLQPNAAEGRNQRKKKEEETADYADCAD